MSIHMNIGGVWKEPAPYMNVGGVWKPCDVYLNVGGVWKKVWSNVTPLFDLAIGTVVNFGGYSWIIVDKGSLPYNGPPPAGTVGLLFNGSAYSGMAYDPDNTKLFDPTDSNNIAYWLNNSFYNSLANNGWIINKAWSISSYPAGYNPSSPTCKVGLLTYWGYENLRGSVLPTGGTGWYWWLATPRPYDNTAWLVSSDGSLTYDSTGSPYYTMQVRPMVYLQAGLYVDSSNNVIAG